MTAGQFHREVERLGLSLSAEQAAAFERFIEALYRANESTNLTRVPRTECRVRHFLDSLLFQSLIPQQARVLDIGSGPGFPAWPLACARPDVFVTALDSNEKMLGFLAAQPLPNLDIVIDRAEDWRTRRTFDFVTGRAVAPLSIQLEISARYCRLDGLVVPMRTPADSAQFERVDLYPLGLALRDVVARTLPVMDAIRLFPIYQKFEETKPGYPRKWAEIKRRPL